MTENTCSQPNIWSNQPINGVNRANDRYCALLKMAPATPRSCAGNQAAITRPEAGPTGASKVPSRKRRTSNAANAEANQPAAPMNMVHADHNTRPPSTVRLAPSLSTSHPAGIWAST
ncbi:hypothetical protein D3C85_1344410 [compost metagenome]